MILRNDLITNIMEQITKTIWTTCKFIECKKSFFTQKHVKFTSCQSQDLKKIKSYVKNAKSKQQRSWQDSTEKTFVVLPKCLQKHVNFIWINDIYSCCKVHSFYRSAFIIIIINNRQRPSLNHKQGKHSFWVEGIRNCHQHFVLISL